MLEAAGYRILAFNTVDFSKSLHYNPLAYVRDEADILEFVSCLIENTTGDREHAGDPFWENAERLLYVALIGWLVAYTREAPLRAKRFTPVSVLFIGSCVLNVLWLALWHFELVAVSFIVILAEWLVLAALYLNVRRTMKTASGRVPVSIYTAWVTVATLANMAILVTRALDGGIPFFNGLFTILLTAGVLAFGYVMRKAYDDMAFQLVFLWALIGVGVNVSGASAFTAAVVFLLCVVGAILTFAPIGSMRKLVRQN